MKYEFYYNEKYAREQNPTLMSFGLTGGFGCKRAMMRKAVEGGDMVKAESYFWTLIYQSLVEARQEEQIVGMGSLDELIECWFDHLLDEGLLAEETHFVRPAVEGSTWDVMYKAFINRYYPGGTNE